MRRKKSLFGILVAFTLTIILFSACSNQGTDNFETPVAIAVNNSFAIRTDNGEYETTFINGVNMGVTKPGFFPGEFAIEREEYLRWFRMIGEMNVNTVRVYVGQMPAFYDALLEYNSKTTKPIYLFQGIYMNEEAIEKYNDAFSGDIEESFLSDIRNVVDMVHGNADIEKLPGNAGGKYRSDIS